MLTENTPIPDTSQPPEFLSDDSLANGFLTAIPEQDRAIVAKYIKDWDAGVTRKFQSIHEQYAPYKEFGSPEDIERALFMENYLQQRPLEFLAQLQEAVDKLKEEGLIEMGTEETVTEPDEELDFNDLPPVWQKKFEALESHILEIDNRFQAKDAEEQERAQMAELDKLMSNLHNEHGNFDDDWVLLQISKGKSPEEAVNMWNTMLEKTVGSSPRKQIPKVLSGNGPTPGNQVDPSKLSAQERIAHVASLIEASRD